MAFEICNYVPSTVADMLGWCEVSRETEDPAASSMNGFQTADDDTQCQCFGFVAPKNNFNVYSYTGTADISDRGRAPVLDQHKAPDGEELSLKPGAPNTAVASPQQQPGAALKTIEIDLGQEQTVSVPRGATALNVNTGTGGIHGEVRRPGCLQTATGSIDINVKGPMKIAIATSTGEINVTSKVPVYVAVQGGTNDVRVSTPRPELVNVTQASTGDVFVPQAASTVNAFPPLPTNTLYVCSSTGSINLNYSD